MNRARQVIVVLRNHFGDIKKDVHMDPFRALVSGILSQNTTDNNSSKAMKMLWSVANKPEEILKLPDSELHRLIHSSGFYVSKGAYIKGASKAILEIFDGNVPDKRDELMRLPGVGPKTADIILSYGFNKASIAVDTHIRRTAIRLGLAGYTYSRENVKRRLEQDIPQRDWDFADEAFLRLGKEYCKPRNPLCVDCPLAKICDFNGDDVNGD